MRGWIPPLPLACGALAFGGSWIVLFAIARSGSFGASALALGWIHLVALGWITLVALSVLLHVVPKFLDVEWPQRPVAAAAVIGYAAGVAALLAGFFSGISPLLLGGATLVLLALVVYAVAIAWPLARAIRTGERTTRAVARAFGGTFAFLLATAVLGTLFAYALAGLTSAAILLAAPRAHAVLGTAGWLTLLILGVSARTLRPITGARSRLPMLHVASGSAVLLGTIAAAVALAVRAPVAAAAGFALALAGIAAYACDVWDILARATVPHRPPHALMACAALAAIVAAVLSGGAALGAPWGAAAVYVALLGWAGGAVLAHLHHIGVRVLLTRVRGEDDETRPQAVLVAPLTWTTVATFEFAVAAGTIGILRMLPGFVEAAAIAGFAGFLSMAANAALAQRNARRLPVTLV